ncbi:MAG: hypothetical protein ACPGED_08225, partial [Flavobacteriales bacterium]
MEFPEENIEQEGAALEQREKQGQAAAAQISEDEIADALERYDGFEELLGPLADNLEKFSPEKKGKKKRFLQDEDLTEERGELRDRLEAYVSFLNSESVSDHKSLKTNAQQKLDQNEELINDNVGAILNEARDLERTYRELETFFRNAAPQKTQNLKLLNVNSETLLDADANGVYNAVEKLILDESKSVDQRKA